MATNIINAEYTVTRVAPSGGVVSGVPFVLGSEFLIPLSTAAAGVRVACVKRGRVRLPAKVNDTFTVGGPVYWHAEDGVCEAATADDNYPVGTSDGDQSGGFVRVDLDGDTLPAIADLVIPSTALEITIGDDLGLFDAETVEDALAEVKALADSALQDASAFATAAQGALADTALQDGTAYATAAQGALADSALQDATAFATAAQGLLADSALQAIPAEVTAGAAAGATALQPVPDADADDVYGSDGAGGLKVVGSLKDLKLYSKSVVIALGATAGTTAADPAWIGAVIVNVLPVSGNDQLLASVAVAGDGVVTVTVASAETAEATFTVFALLD